MGVTYSVRNGSLAAEESPYTQADAATRRRLADIARASGAAAMLILSRLAVS